MFKPKVLCSNLNHGKSISPIRFCPTCGARFKTSAPAARCDHEKHAMRLKDRNLFCFDCGKDLKK